MPRHKMVNDMDYSGSGRSTPVPQLLGHDAKDHDTSSTISRVEQLMAAAEESQNKGLLKQAVPIRVMIRNLLADTFGETADVTITAAKELALLYMRMEDFKQAQPLLENLYQIKIQEAQEKTKSSWIVAYQLGKLYLKLERLTDSMACLEVARDIADHVYQPMEPNIGITCINLARAYYHILRGQAIPSPDLAQAALDQAQYAAQIAFANPSTPLYGQLSKIFTLQAEIASAMHDTILEEKILMDHHAFLSENLPADHSSLTTIMSRLKRLRKRRERCCRKCNGRNTSAADANSAGIGGGHDNHCMHTSVASSVETSPSRSVAHSDSSSVTSYGTREEDLENGGLESPPSPPGNGASLDVTNLLSNMAHSSYESDDELERRGSITSIDPIDPINRMFLRNHFPSFSSVDSNSSEEMGGVNPLEGPDSHVPRSTANRKARAQSMQQRARERVALPPAASQQQYQHQQQSLPVSASPSPSTRFPPHAQRSSAQHELTIMPHPATYPDSDSYLYSSDIPTRPRVPSVRLPPSTTSSHRSSPLTVQSELFPPASSPQHVSPQRSPSGQRRPTHRSLSASASSATQNSQTSLADQHQLLQRIRELEETLHRAQIEARVSSERIQDLEKANQALRDRNLQQENAIKQLRGDPNSLRSCSVDLLSDLMDMHHDALKTTQAQFLSMTAKTMRDKLLAESRDVDKHICRVCMDRPVELCLKPCGHTCLCLKCADQLVNCPLCRSEIDDRIQVFLT